MYAKTYVQTALDAFPCNTERRNRHAQGPAQPQISLTCMYYSTSLKLQMYPSQDSSVGSISARYRGGPGFKSQQRREFFNENKLLNKLEFEYCVESRLYVGALVP